MEEKTNIVEIIKNANDEIICAIDPSIEVPLVLKNRMKREAKSIKFNWNGKIYNNWKRQEHIYFCNNFTFDNHKTLNVSKEEIIELNLFLEKIIKNTNNFTDRSKGYFLNNKDEMDLYYGVLKARSDIKKEKNNNYVKIILHNTFELDTNSIVTYTEVKEIIDSKIRSIKGMTPLAVAKEFGLTKSVTSKNVGDKKVTYNIIRGLKIKENK